MEFSPTPADWLKILKKKNITNPDLDKVVKRHERKPKSQPGVTPGHGTSRNRGNETISPEGKVEPHKPSR